MTAMIMEIEGDLENHEALRNKEIHGNNRSSKNKEIHSMEMILKIKEIPMNLNMFTLR